MISINLQPLYEAVLKLNRCRRDGQFALQIVPPKFFVNITHLDIYIVFSSGKFRFSMRFRPQHILSLTKSQIVEAFLSKLNDAMRRRGIA